MAHKSNDQNKKKNRRPTQEPKMPEETAAPPPQETTDSLADFISSLQLNNQEDVRTIVHMTKFTIDKKLNYLEDYLTVGQLKTCRRLLEEQISDFKQFLPKEQINLVERMISKQDFETIRDTISDNLPALRAFENYMKFNRLQQNEPEPQEESEEEEVSGKDTDEEHTRRPKGGPNCHCVKHETSEEEISDEEGASDSDDLSEEEEKPKPYNSAKNKDKPKRHWGKDIHRPTREKSYLTHMDIWKMAEKAATEIAELKEKVKTLETDNSRLTRKLQEAEQIRKKERDELNQYNEKKMQEASKNYLEEMKKKEQALIDQHAREMATARRALQNNAQNNHEVDHIYEHPAYTMSITENPPLISNNKK